METIDYLEQLWLWKVDADVKFMYIKVDGVPFRLQLRGQPKSLGDPQLDFDCVQMDVGQYQMYKMYYIKDDIVNAKDA